MSIDVVAAPVQNSVSGEKRRSILGSRTANLLRSFALALTGTGILLAVWWIGGWLVASNPATANFAGFAPAPASLR